MKLAEQEQLFCQWLTAHRGLLWRVVRAFASDAPDQEDLFQEILLVQCLVENWMTAL
jgi:DNA-directed RNA polymerase specialized sigma24 family protein